MAQMLIRQLDARVKERLKRRARRNGRSMEEEARCILQQAVREDAPAGLGSHIAARFSSCGLDEEIPQFRGQTVRPVDLGP